MEVSKILKMDCSETEKLGMLFSGRIGMIEVLEAGRGAVTVKAWDNLFQDLIAWKNTPVKIQECEKCYIDRELIG